MQFAEVLVRSRQGSLSAEEFESIAAVLNIGKFSSDKFHKGLPRVIRQLARTEPFWLDNRCLTLLDTVGRSGDGEFWILDVDPVISAFNTHPELRGLLVLIADHALTRRTYPSGERFASSAARLGAKAFEYMVEDNPSIGYAVTILRLVTNRDVAHSAAGVSDALCSINSHLDASDIRDLLSQSRDAEEVRKIIREMVSGLKSKSWSRVEACYLALKGEVDTKKSPIGSRSECERLSLPHLDFC